MSAWVDKKLGKFASRKLLVFVAATVALATGVITGAEWNTTAIAYVGTQGFVDFAATIIRARAGSE